MEFCYSHSTLENSILDAREERYSLIKSLVKDYQVVTLKANIPGTDKNIKVSNLLLHYFNKPLESLNPTDKRILSGPDGRTIIYLFKKGTISKNVLEEIESLELGRFVDIDLYESDRSVSRAIPRKCFICNDYAFNCIRNRRHSSNELIQRIEHDTYLAYSNIIEGFIKLSMIEELKLYPKFGLVSFNDSGSHEDMNHLTMLKAMDAITPYFKKMFMVALTEGNNNLFPKIREIGVEAENEMFKATGGINCYKGLIYMMGLISSSLGLALQKADFKMSDIFDIIQELSKESLRDFDKEPTTSGEILYKNYGIRGIRGEALEGFKVLRYLYNTYDLNQYDGKMKALIYLISRTDDTVLLKRCGSIEKFNEIRHEFKKMKYEETVINAMNERCINEKLSFGGSADLLISAIFLNFLKKTIE